MNYPGSSSFLVLAWFLTWPLHIFPRQSVPLSWRKIGSEVSWQKSEGGAEGATWRLAGSRDAMSTGLSGLKGDHLTGPLGYSLSSCLWEAPIPSIIRRWMETNKFIMKTQKCGCSPVPCIHSPAQVPCTREDGHKTLRIRGAGLQVPIFQVRKEHKGKDDI